MGVSEGKCWANIYLRENETNTAFMYFSPKRFQNHLEKVRFSLGSELGPSQDQKDVLAVSFLNQQFVAKMQGMVAEEAREGREGYLLSRLCQ